MEDWDGKDFFLKKSDALALIFAKNACVCVCVCVCGRGGSRS